jgi:hypothetical protein
VPKADASKVAASTGEPGVDESMMPWNGWFSRLLKDKLGEDKFQKLRNVMLFRPDDIHNLEGVPINARQKVPGVDRIQGYRYPSPAERTPANIPRQDYDPTGEGGIGKDPFNIAYYARDTRRNDPSTAIHSFPGQGMKIEAPHRSDKIRVIDANSPMTNEQESIELANPATMGSPGNNSVFATGKSSYDDTGGLRAAMSTSHEKMNAELLKHMPTQLPKYEWEDRQDELCAKWDAHGLPPSPGAPVKWNMPDQARVASW